MLSNTVYVSKTFHLSFSRPMAKDLCHRLHPLEGPFFLTWLKSPWRPLKNGSQARPSRSWSREKGSLKRASVTTTASVCKPTTRAMWALLFWPTWPASSVCKPMTFVVTERGFRRKRPLPEPSYRVSCFINLLRFMIDLGFRHPRWDKNGSLGTNQGLTNGEIPRKIFGHNTDHKPGMFGVSLLINLLRKRNDFIFRHPRAQSIFKECIQRTSYCKCKFKWLNMVSMTQYR